MDAFCATVEQRDNPDLIGNRFPCPLQSTSYYFLYSHKNLEHPTLGFR